MGLKEYQMISRFVAKNLSYKYHSRHLEDAIQYVALCFFEGRTNLRWSLIHYSISNGIHKKKGKLGAKTLEQCVFVGQGNENGHCEFLLDSKVESVKIDVEDIVLDIMDGLKLKTEVSEWATKNYLSYHKKKNYNTLTRLLK
jgi:hypothetical protein